jgi:hypothetical protein
MIGKVRALPEIARGESGPLARSGASRRTPGSCPLGRPHIGVGVARRTRIVRGRKI